MDNDIKIFLRHQTEICIHMSGPKRIGVISFTDDKLMSNIVWVVTKKMDVLQLGCSNDRPGWCEQSTRKVISRDVIIKVILKEMTFFYSRIQQVIQ